MGLGNIVPHPFVPSMPHSIHATAPPSTQNFSSTPKWFSDKIRYFWRWGCHPGITALQIFPNLPTTSVLSSYQVSRSNDQLKCFGSLRCSESTEMPSEIENAESDRNKSLDRTRLNLIWTKQLLSHALTAYRNGQKMAQFAHDPCMVAHVECMIANFTRIMSNITL